MTKTFDDDARIEVLNYYQSIDFKYDGEPIREMIVKPITVKEARGFISTFHYSRTMPDSTRFVFAGYLGKKLAGIICYGMGAGKAQYVKVLPDIENGQYIELTRLWCPNDMPKNTESKLIAESLKMLPDEIKLVVSYADESKNHVGTIYQATNWYYLGRNDGGGKVLICEDGTVKHNRLLGMYRKRNPELRDLSNEEIMAKYGWTWGQSGRKYKYVFLRGSRKEKKEMLQQFEHMIQPYPKGSNTAQEVSELEIIDSEINKVPDYQYTIFNMLESI